ncbi:MAG TPA: hypothetical protein VJT33_05070 [bacterium]|nr:hypothetical protein [bacterium]
MSTSLLIPLNEQGTFTDTGLIQALADASAAAPTISDVFLYSHGWWTNANAAMVDYDRFTAGLDRALGTDPATQQLVRQNIGTFISAGVHWPSVLTEDATNPLNYLEAASYYTMRERADDVGSNGGYAILHSALGPKVTRAQLIGHSFGCRVVCSALAKFVASAAGAPNTLPNVRFNVVLIEAAFDQDNLSPTGPYASLLTDPRVRILVTHSAKDWSLTSAYPIANLVFDVVNHPGFATAARGLSDTLDAGVTAGQGPAEIASQLADRFIHVNVASADAKPGLLGQLQSFLTSRLAAIKGDAQALGMDVLAQAATALGHDVAHALGADGPLPAIMTAAGTQYANLTIGADWPMPPGPGVEPVATDLGKRLVVADLTPLHTSREPVAWPNRDHHSDINALEIYRLVAGFLWA